MISGIELLVDQKARVDVMLQVGETRASVSVVGSAPLVDSTTASVGTVVGEQQVLDLPLNLRRLSSLATLVPGTVGSTSYGYAFTIAGGSTFSEASYVVGAARDSSNTLVIDGMESKAYDTGGFALAPPPDAVKEFKIQTNIYSAAFGKTAGSTMNVVTNSGTNQWHGDAYEFLRNDKLDGRNFFATNQTNPTTGQEIPGSARPEYRRSQFGFTLGGPIQKDRTFVFGFYDALREIKGLSLGNFVPTDAERKGDFSDFLTGQTSNLCGKNGPANLNFDSGQLFDPGTESLFTCPAGSGNAGSAILVGNPVPGNVISNIDPVAMKVLAMIPEPNRPGFPNFVNQTPRVRSDNQFGVRVDHSFSTADRVFVRYLFGQSNITDPSLGFSTLPGFGDRVFFRGQNAVVGWTHSIGANLLNELRIGFQRNNPVEDCQNCPRPAGFEENFGIKGLKALSPANEQFPWVSFVNFTGVGDAAYRPVTGVEMTEDYGDNLTWIHGRHTITVGADLAWLQRLRLQNPISPAGRYSFDGRFSSLAGEVPGVAGVSDLADLLLGYPASADRTLRFQDFNQVGGTYWNFFGQDDIRVRHNLSVNLGLRYEYRRAPVNKSNNIVGYQITGPLFSGPGNAFLATGLPDAQNDALCGNPAYAYLISASGQCLVLSSAMRRQYGFTGRTRRSQWFSNPLDFAPRVGLAWRPTSSDRFVLRGGYGIFYDMYNTNTRDDDNNPIFAPIQRTNTAFGAPPPLTNGVLTTFENVFAGGGVPLLADQLPLFGDDPHFPTPYLQEWSLGVQSQLSTNWALDFSYVGEVAHHLDNLHVYGNQPRPGVGDLQPRRPYVDFGPAIIVTPDGNSNYNALQAKLTKRFSAGLLFLTAYTWGRTMTDAEGNEQSFGQAGNQVAQDDNNRLANYARGVSDARQRLVFSPIWQLPVGQGKRFLNRTGILNAALGNWEASGILTLQSGLPFTVFAGQDFSNTGTIAPRTDRICSGGGDRTVASWFNTSCFTVGALEQALAAGQPRFGNSGRNILDGPGLADVDFALIKNFMLGERAKVEFRAEAFNLLNHPNFSEPNGTEGSPNFGAIGAAGDPRDIQFALKVIF